MNKLCIFLAEDNPGDVELVRLALEVHGVAGELRIACSGDEAFALFAQIGASLPHPDLILMDLNLPGWNGIELLKMLRSSDASREVPVIVMTSSRLPAHRREAEQLRIHHFFSKPADLDEFLELGAIVKDVLSKQSGVSILSDSLRRA